MEKLIERIKYQISCFKSEKSKVDASQIDKLSLGGRIAALEELLVFINEKQDNRPLASEILSEQGWENSIQYTAGGDKLKKQEKRIDDNRIVILYHSNGDLHIFNNKSTLDVTAKLITVGEFNTLLYIVKLDKFKIK